MSTRLYKWAKENLPAAAELDDDELRKLVRKCSPLADLGGLLMAVVSGLLPVLFLQPLVRERFPELSTLWAAVIVTIPVGLLMYAVLKTLELYERRNLEQLIAENESNR